MVGRGGANRTRRGAPSRHPGKPLCEPDGDRTIDRPESDANADPDSTALDHSLHEGEPCSYPR